MTDEYIGAEVWRDDVLIIRDGDNVSGAGPSDTTGIANAPHKELADRTAYLKSIIDKEGGFNNQDDFHSVPGYEIHDVNMINISHIDTDRGYLVDKIQDGNGIVTNIITDEDGKQKIEFTCEDAFKLKVSSNDTTQNYLSSKLIVNPYSYPAGSPLSFTELSNGSNEQYRLTFNYPGKILLNGSDTTYGYLKDKITYDSDKLNIGYSNTTGNWKLNFDIGQDVFDKAENSLKDIQDDIWYASDDATNPNHNNTTTAYMSSAGQFDVFTKVQYVNQQGLLTNRSYADSSITEFKIHDDAIVTNKIHDQHVKWQKLEGTQILSIDGGHNGWTEFNYSEAYEELDDLTYYGTGCQATNASSKVGFHRFIDNISELPSSVYFNPSRDTFSNIQDDATYRKVVSVNVDGLTTSNSYSIESIEDKHIAKNTIDATERIKSSSITRELLQDSVFTNMPAGIIGTTQLSNNSITESKIVNDSVSWAKLSDGAVISSKIHDGAVTSSKISNGDILSDHINNGAIVEDKIAANAITATKIAENAVNNRSLGIDAVGHENIQNDAIGQDQLQDNSVGSAQLQGGAIGGGSIGDDTIDTSHIRNYAVTTVKIDPGAINSNLIAPGAVRNSHLTVDSVQNQNIVSLEVTKLTGLILPTQIPDEFIKSQHFSKDGPLWLETAIGAHDLYTERIIIHTSDDLLVSFNEFMAEENAITPGDVQTSDFKYVVPNINFLETGNYTINPSAVDHNATQNYSPDEHLPPKVTTNSSDTTYTFTIDDANKYFRCDALSTFMIPLDTTAAIPINSEIKIMQLGVEKITIAEEAGVVINSKGGLLSTNGQYSVITLKKVSTDIWDVWGDLS